LEKETPKKTPRAPTPDLHKWEKKKNRAQELDSKKKTPSEHGKAEEENRMISFYPGDWAPHLILQKHGKRGKRMGAITTMKGSLATKKDRGLVAMTQIVEAEHQTRRATEPHLLSNQDQKSPAFAAKGVA